MIEFGHATHKGLRSGHNEDTYWADASLGLFVVADGMGGYGRGEVAAAIALRVVIDAVRSGRDLDAAIRSAGEAIRAAAVRSASAVPMGTTLAALRIQPSTYEAVCVGDSRVLLWQQGQLGRIEASGRPPAEQATDGATGEAAIDPPLPNRPTHALGITPPAHLGSALAKGALTPGTQFLICSDGLTGIVDADVIAACLARAELAAQECVDQLILAALDAGGRDDVTVLVVRIT